MNEYGAIVGEYKRQFIDDIIDGMTPILDNNQLKQLYQVLNKHTVHLDFGSSPNPDNVIDYKNTNEILVREFLMSKKLEGCSPRTCNAYETWLKKLLEWTIKPISSLTSEDLKEYLVFYQELNNCSNISLDNNRRCLSSFYRWLTDEEYIIVNPMQRIPKIKYEKKVKKAFTNKEIELMRGFLNSKGYKERINMVHLIRNKAIFEFLLSSGVRVNELCNLKIQDLDLDENKGLVLGKGNKERIIYYSESAKQLIIQYLEKRNSNSEYLFLGSTGKNAKRPLGIAGVERFIRELGNEVGTEAHPHKFRRTFATNLIRKGMPIDQVQHLLGHSSLEVTLTYIESDEDALQMVHRKFV